MDARWTNQDRDDLNEIDKQNKLSMFTKRYTNDRFTESIINCVKNINYIEYKKCTSWYVCRRLTLFINVPSRAAMECLYCGDIRRVGYWQHFKDLNSGRCIWQVNESLKNIVPHQTHIYLRIIMWSLIPSQRLQVIDNQYSWQTN